MSKYAITLSLAGSSAGPFVAQLFSVAGETFAKLHLPGRTVAQVGVEIQSRNADISNVRARAGIVLVTALVLAGIDLVVNAVVAADPSFAHHRSLAWVEVSVGLFVLALVLARLPSRVLATGAGVFAGGLLGNLASAAMHGRTVANPFVVGDVAFNLADVVVLAGIVLVIVATMRLAVRYRHLLPTHTIPVRIVRHVRARRAT